MNRNMQLYEREKKTMKINPVFVKSIVVSISALIGNSIGLLMPSPGWHHCVNACVHEGTGMAADVIQIG